MLIDIQGISFRMESIQGYEPDWDAASQDANGAIIPGVKVHTTVTPEVVRTIHLTGQAAEIFRALVLLYQSKGLIMDGALAAVQFMQSQQTQAQKISAQIPKQSNLRVMPQPTDAELRVAGIGVDEAQEPVVTFSDDVGTETPPTPGDASQGLQMSKEQNIALIATLLKIGDRIRLGETYDHVVYVCLAREILKETEKQIAEERKLEQAKPRVDFQEF